MLGSDAVGASAGRHRKRRALCHLTPLAHRYYLREIESLARARQPHHWSAWLAWALVATDLVVLTLLT